MSPSQERLHMSFKISTIQEQVSMSCEHTLCRVHALTDLRSPIILCGQNYLPFSVSSLKCQQNKYH